MLLCACVDDLTTDDLVRNGLCSTPNSSSMQAPERPDAVRGSFQAALSG